jgi:hypothetical protein
VQLLDASLYELGCVEVGRVTRNAILDELGRDSVFSTSSAEFPEAAIAVFQFIVASPEFQFA